MKYRTYMISILLTIALTVCGLYLPSFAFSKQNRETLITPGSYEISGANLYYSTSFLTVMRVFSTDYELINYDSTDSLHLKHNRQEVLSKIHNFLNSLCEYFGYSTFSKDSLEKNYYELNPCLIIKNAVIGNSSYSNSTTKNEASMSMSSASSTDKTPAVNENSDVIYEEFSNDILFFVWKYYIYIDDIEFTFYIDDGSCKVIAFEITDPTYNAITYTYDFKEPYDIEHLYYSKLVNLISLQLEANLNNITIKEYNKKTNVYSYIFTYYYNNIDDDDNFSYFDINFKFSYDRISMNM